ncbi:helix-turn-helix transcriptional regulator [Kaistia sp. 32K]|uniref:helix-turn-helix transcriptional regulator n=1 Tax=Kaistia sp. 32K TaxID=2795690 RepID=UPI0019165F98|nr:helix-turn-helix transcriptional regulator [Kaistia sp. 32K]
MSEILDSAALDPSRWSEFIDRLSRHTGDSKIIFQAFDDDLTWCTPMHSAGFSEQSLRNYAGYFASISPWLPLLGRIRLGEIALTDHHLPLPELHRTEFYNDMLRPEGAADSATGVHLFSESNRKATLAVHFSSQDAEAMHAKVAPILDGLTRRMRQTLNVNRALAKYANTFNENTSLLHSLALPALIIDQEGRVLALNTAATELLGQHNAVTIDGADRFRFASTRFQAQFQQRLGEAATGSAGDLHLDHPEMPLTISVLPFTGRPPDTKGVGSLFTSDRNFLVLLRRQPLLAPCGALVEKLEKHFRLTPAEIRIVVALSQGENLGSLAAAWGVSPHTIRAQLRSAFAKTDTHKQHELVALTHALRDR